MISFIEYLKLPATIGGILDFKGKTVPVIMNMRKRFKQKKQEKAEISKTLSEVKALLGEVNAHYSADNITKRDAWMKWVNDRAAVYDESIVAINQKLSEVTEALRDNTKMTEEMFIQSSRDRIIDFATKVENPNTMVSREEFNRIFKVYDRYEKFLKERELTNGEIDVNYQIIKESYEEHLRGHTFIEDARGFTKV